MEALNRHAVNLLLFLLFRCHFSLFSVIMSTSAADEMHDNVMMMKSSLDVRHYNIVV